MLCFAVNDSGSKGRSGSSIQGFTLTLIKIHLLTKACFIVGLETTRIMTDLERKYFEKMWVPFYSVSWDVCLFVSWLVSWLVPHYKYV